MNKKVFISGCYDLLHSGHVAFFMETASYGDLYVGIGSDQTIEELKGRATINSEQERLFMVQAVRYVKDSFINSGSGMMDFEADLNRLQPDFFIVNEDGFSPVKKELCNNLGIELIVLNRIPSAGLPKRSTTALRSGNRSQLPYRIDLAGTWIDQPYVSKHKPGWAVTLSLEPVIEYNERCGMSTSTRNAAKHMWPNFLPLEKPEKLAEILFRHENKPGTKIISGAQDAIGICMPGLVRHYYNNDYWPEQIESIHDDAVLDWLEAHLYMVLLWPRPEDLDLLSDTQINIANVENLTVAAEALWEAVQNKDLPEFTKAFSKSFEAQIALFPSMVNEKINTVIDSYKEEALAWKLAGAGGGGYLILVSEKPIKDAMRIKIRRKDSGY